MCVCVCTHTTATICCRESHTVRSFNPVIHTFPQALSQGSPPFDMKTFFLVMVVTAATQTHISLFFLRFLPSLAQFMLRNRLVPCLFAHTAELLPELITFNRRRVKAFFNILP